MLMQWQSQIQSWMCSRHLLWRHQGVKGKRERNGTKRKGQRYFPKCVCVCVYCLQGSCAESFAAPRLSLFLSLLSLQLIAIIAGLRVK